MGKKLKPARPTELYRLLEDRKVNYPAIAKECDFVIDNESERDVNIFLATKGREDHVKMCLKYLSEALKDFPKKAIVTVLENDNVKRHLQVAADYGYGHIFLPEIHSNSQGLIAKSLLWNLGYLMCPKPKWYIFYDVDMLVEKDFFNKLTYYLDQAPSFVQPYTQRRVRNLPSAVTTLLMGQNGDKPLSSFPSVPELKGSTGGIIAVRRESFEAVGGFDPEFCYGYSTEDQLFWLKLECIALPINTVPDIHCGAAVYADDPPIEIYHMHHETLKHVNPFYEIGKRILLAMKLWDHVAKMEIIDRKRKILNDAAQNFS